MGIGTGQVTMSSDVYATYAKTSETKVEKTKGEEAVEKAATEGAVYEKSEASSTTKEPYKINKMSQEERTALVNSMKADLESRKSQLQELVTKMLGQQSGVAGLAEGDDSIWKLFANGKVTVDDAAREQAQKDIAEDGYWGVKQTSERLFDFASALAGDDVDKMKSMQSAMHKGYDQATKAWGKELPDISKKTIEAADKLFEDYYASKNSGTEE